MPPTLKILNTHMNTKPNIFVVYLAGTFGNFVANLFYGAHIDIKGDVDQRNAHASKKDAFTFDAFKKHNSTLSKQDIESFDNQKTDVGIHTLPFYHWLDFDFAKYFSNHKKIIIVPDEAQIPIVAKRLYEVFLKHPNDLNSQGIKEIVLKNLNLPDKSYPEYFLDEICIKETIKNLNNDYRNWKRYKPNGNDLIIPFSKIKDIDFLENCVYEVVNEMDIRYSGFPLYSAKNFLHKNQEYFVDTSNKIN